MASNLIGNRNSTPEAVKSTLRSHQSRVVGAPSNLRSSADMSAFTTPQSSQARNIRPASEVLYNNQQAQQMSQDDSGRVGEQWIQDIEQYEVMLEEMAAATLDTEFKDELSAIEQWFRVLSEAERTAATYALIQQTTQMQQRFFAQVLNQMSKSHPIAGVLSPANFNSKDAMSERMNEAMGNLNLANNRASVANRPMPSPAGPAVNKRNSSMEPSQISALFPDAVAAIAQQKADYQQQTGQTPASNRNSVMANDRLSVPGPGLSASRDKTGDMSHNWRVQTTETPSLTRQTGPPPMGQFSQPLSSANNLRSPRPLQQTPGNITSTTLETPQSRELPVLSPYGLANQSWASLSATPMVPNFNHAAAASAQSEMVANATAMKLAALSTHNNRIALDDVKQYRRDRSKEAVPYHTQSQISPALVSTGIPGINTVMVNDAGQILNPQQIAALQAQQMAATQASRSRPNSPGFPLQNALAQAQLQAQFASPQQNGYLAAMNGNPMLNLPGLMPMGQFTQHDGHGFLGEDIQRGRSPRGRRGTSKPPEDPTDPRLLQNIPDWLRSLRLHKYTDNLKDMKWEDLVKLDEAGLEAKGVGAQGARTKMLKVFEQVREAQNEGKL